MTDRTNTTTQKVRTKFGVMYIHIDTDADGQPCGGGISTPGKGPKSEIHKLVETLSAGLDAALSGGRDASDK